jgi:hypothetical protein
VADAIPGGGSFAQVASAGGWNTTFTFVNTGRGSAQVTLNFSDAYGNPLFLPLHFPQAGTSVTAASSVTKTFTPNTSFIVETQGLDSQPGWRAQRV